MRIASALVATRCAFSPVFSPMLASAKFLAVAVICSIWLEDADNHGTESYVISVADYAGRAVRNYRYGPVLVHTNGGARYDMGPTGDAAFEAAGALELAGRPFMVSGSDVP